MRGLPAGWYRDAARSTRELTTLFLRSWQFVCHASDLPSAGTAARFDCAGRSALVVRHRDGTLRAFRNTCRHRGARLVDGDAHTGLAFSVDGRVRCPYHGWTYDDTGSLVAIPGTQDFGTIDRTTHGLHPIQVEQWRGLVFVAFDAPSSSLAQMLDPVVADWPDMATLRRLSEPRATMLAADWKLACQQLLDTAHFDVPRPSLKPRVFASPRYTPCGKDAVRATVALEQGGNALWSARVYQRLLSPDATAATPRAEFLYVWPNLLLCLSPDGLRVAQVLPGAPGCSVLREVRCGSADTRRTMRLLRYAHERVARRARGEDLRLLERTQHGLGSLDDDEAGPLDAREAGLRWFVERYHAALPGVAAPAAQTTRVKRARTTRKAVTATLA